MNIRKNVKKVISAVLRLHLKYKQKSAAADWDISDVYLVSYPKSGISWVCLVLANIFKQLRKESRRIDFLSMHDYIPDLHANPNRILQLPPPRIIKTHECFDEWYRRIYLKGRGVLFPRVIYLVRDGRDVMVSYYHYVKGLFGYKGGFAKFLNDKRIKRDDWSKHVSNWIISNTLLDKRQKLLIKYEDLRADTAKEVKKMVDFIGIEAGEKILKNAIISSDIKKIRKLEDIYGDGVKYANPEYRFARKGTMGDIDKELREIINEYYNKNLKIFRYLGYE